MTDLEEVRDVLIDIQKELRDLEYHALEPANAVERDLDMEERNKQEIVEAVSCAYNDVHVASNIISDLQEGVDPEDSQWLKEGQT